MLALLAMGLLILKNQFGYTVFVFNLTTMAIVRILFMLAALIFTWGLFAAKRHNKCPKHKKLLKVGTVLASILSLLIICCT